MQFDLTTFLTAIFEAFLECRRDGETAPASEMIKNRPIVKLVARRELVQQAREQGAGPREARRFAREHMAEALEGLDKAVADDFG